MKALVVDDNPTSRLVLRKIIGDELEVEVIEAADGREALQRIEEDRPTVVFLDLEMPTLDGVATLSEIRQRWGDLPVMVVTAHAEPEFVRRMMSLGVTDYVLKPVNREVLSSRLARLRDKVPGLPQKAKPAKPALDDEAETDPAPATSENAPA